MSSKGVQRTLSVPLLLISVQDRRQRREAKKVERHVGNISADGLTIDHEKPIACPLTPVEMEELPSSTEVWFGWLNLEMFCSCLTRSKSTS
eukprot:symbB.v1.2.031799.t1/scaffold3725.1/size51411/4